LAKKRYNKETNCSQGDTDCASLYENVLGKIFSKALLLNVNNFIMNAAANDIAGNIDLYDRLLYIAEKTDPTREAYTRVFLVMVEDLIFRAYENVKTNSNDQDIR